MKKRLFAAFAAWTLLSSSAFALNDTYDQTFDGMQEGATVQGADSFAVVTGDANNAVTLSGETATGSGKALQLTGATTSVKVERPGDYGGLSPTWVEIVTKPSIGVDERAVPATGIAAVNFSSSGSILASDGAHWVSTGKTFDANSWYRISLRLDFSDHMYKIYIAPAGSPKNPFVPDKENLHFINTSVNSLNGFGFLGAYDEHSQQDAKVDEVRVDTIDKVQIITAPQTLVKGFSSGPITVQLQNSNSELQTAWTDMTLALQASTNTAEFSLDKTDWVPVHSVLIPKGAQQAVFYFRDFTLGRPTVTVSEDPDRGWSDALQEEKIVSEGEYFGISATTPQVAGRPFDVQIIAKDSVGHPDPAYSGSVELSATYVSPASGLETVAPATAGDFVQGVKDVFLTYPDAGTIKIAAQDVTDTSKIGYSGEINFLADTFSVSAASPQVVSKPFRVTVQALSADGHVTKNYQGPVKLEAVGVNPLSTSGGVFSPGQAGAELFQGGSASVNASYNRWGTLAIRASDTTAPEHKGQSEPVLFVPKSISIKVKTPSESRDFFYVHENIELTVSLLGEDGLPIENFQGAVTMTPTPPFDLASSYDFKESDKGQKIFIVPAGSPGNYTLEVKDAGDGLTATSDKIEVKDATIAVSTTSAPIGTTVIEVQLLDSHGKRITTENDMMITIILHEENDNGSVFFSEAGKPILFRNGVAKIVIGDNEAETVSVVAKSAYGLKVVNGKVVFGRAGASGIGSLMLRETKD